MILLTYGIQAWILPQGTPCELVAGMRVWSLQNLSELPAARRREPTPEERVWGNPISLRAPPPGAISLRAEVGQEVVDLRQDGPPFIYQDACTGEACPIPSVYLVPAGLPPNILAACKLLRRRGYLL